jgi:CheY-like chemotaxis protein
LRPDVKIIAISGSVAGDAYLNASSKLGAQAVLSKPFRGPELRDLVNRVLSAEHADPPEPPQ